MKLKPKIQTHLHQMKHMKKQQHTHTNKQKRIPFILWGRHQTQGAKQALSARKASPPSSSSRIGGCNYIPSLRFNNSFIPMKKSSSPETGKTTTSSPKTSSASAFISLIVPATFFLYLIYIFLQKATNNGF